MSFKTVTPNLMVEDVNQTIEYYQTQLDFELMATVPEKGDLAWAMMQRDSVTLMFQQRENLLEEIPILADQSGGGALTLYIDVDNVSELHQSLQDKVEMVQTLHTTFYGRTEFAIKDCNGFVLAFAGSEV